MSTEPLAPIPLPVGEFLGQFGAHVLTHYSVASTGKGFGGERPSISAEEQRSADGETEQRWEASEQSCGGASPWGYWGGEGREGGRMGRSI